MHTTRPCDRWAFATWDHANAPSESQAIRDEVRSPRRNAAAATITTVVQATVPANGIERTSSEVVIIAATESPASVAATCPSRSIRRNA